MSPETAERLWADYQREAQAINENHRLAIRLECERLDKDLAALKHGYRSLFPTMEAHL